ncbi:MAG: prolyl oligopeptidase family serine peptidase [Blastocatellia bacterium]|nr:prolyl oligopeptidase family serine peptidase [Blastocatellia bacterium]
MRGPEMIGTPPARVRWSPDSQKIYFSWKEPGTPREKDPDTYMVNRDGSNLTKLSEEAALSAPPDRGHTSLDKRLTVYTRDGDLFLYDRQKQTTKRLTQTTSFESNPHFTRDGKRFWFTEGMNLFLFTLEDGSVRQVTNFRSGHSTGPVETKEKGTESQEYLKKEEQELLGVVKKRAQLREEREAKQLKKQPLKPWQIASDLAVDAMELTPDEQFVILALTETARGSRTANVPQYVTESAYAEQTPTRNKVGDVQNRSKLAVLSLASGELKFFEHGLKTTRKKAPEGKEPETVERGMYYSLPVWSDDGKHAVALARATDNKDQWVMQVDPAQAKLSVRVTIHDDAWVDFPGTNTLGWLPDNQNVYFEWERDGYAHLYKVGYDGGEPMQLTTGKFEVDNVVLSEDKTKFYFTSNEVHPGEVNLYEMPVSGGERTRLTSRTGSSEGTVSPDGTALAVMFSTANRPPELFVQDAKPGSEAKQITTSPTAEWLSYPWSIPPVVTFPARDGATVYARLYKPAKPAKNGPAVVFVHGAGYLQNAHKYWSYYYREYMFHHFLVEHGYTVMDLDYRASAGYGRDWRTGIYRFMGGKDLSDNVDAARWLAANHGVDPKRIGIYGGSYGGFITLMAMFTDPDVFAAGAALRPVTDWAHYNHEYTSNILNNPQDDPEAYRKSSPIYHAQGLKGALLICHGMVDLNVHYQDSVRLAQRLIELRKENWELASYPVEDHAFVENSSWADEYKRIFKLFETNLKKR